MVGGRDGTCLCLPFSHPPPPLLLLRWACIAHCLLCCSAVHARTRHQHRCCAQATATSNTLAYPPPPPQHHYQHQHRDALSHTHAPLPPTVPPTNRLRHQVGCIQGGPGAAPAAHPAAEAGAGGPGARLPGLHPVAQAWLCVLCLLLCCLPAQVSQPTAAAGPQPCTCAGFDSGHLPSPPIPSSRWAPRCPPPSAAWTASPAARSSSQVGRGAGGGGGGGG